MIVQVSLNQTNLPKTCDIRVRYEFQTRHLETSKTDLHQSTMPDAMFMSEPFGRAGVRLASKQPVRDRIPEDTVHVVTPSSHILCQASGIRSSVNDRSAWLVAWICFLTRLLWGEEPEESGAQICRLVRACVVIILSCGIGSWGRRWPRRFL